MNLIFDIRNLTKARVDKKFLVKIARTVLKIARIKRKIELSLIIVEEGEIKKINRWFRGEDLVTDVLSFGQETKKYLGDFISAPDGIRRLGEIFICYPQAQKQAKILGHSTKLELGILFIHGILHLLGFNDQGKTEKLKMQKKERETLKTIGDYANI